MSQNDTKEGGSERLEEAIRNHLEAAGTPQTMEEICRNVADDVGCKLTEVEKRVRAIPDVEQGGQLWWFSE